MSTIIYPILHTHTFVSLLHTHTFVSLPFIYTTPGVNLFIPQPFTLDMEKLAMIKPKLESIMTTRLGESAALDLHKKAQDYQIPFDEQADAILSEKVPVFSWTFGLPSKERLEQFKKANITTGSRLMHW